MLVMMLRKPQLKAADYGGFEPLDLTPVIACERTATGWRGLTEDGEILNVNAHVNGSPATIPESLAIMRAGELIGYRKVQQETHDGLIDAYEHHRRASALALRANDFVLALAECEAALKLAPTSVIKYNLAIILLHMERWAEGLRVFADCERQAEPFMRPAYRAAIKAGLTPWQGEDLSGKRLLLVHDHGYGDSILMLRFVPRLQAMGAQVVLQMPPELERLASQVAPVTRELIDTDYVCGFFMMLLHEFRMTPDQIPTEPYLKVDPALVEKWRPHISSERKNIGIVWSVGHDHVGDYPRATTRAAMIQALSFEGELFNVQQQSMDSTLGIRRDNSRDNVFEDFADCAALMSLMDEIVTVDTAAVHLAGAIGHPNITLLLSHWASWRWNLPLYQKLRICQQDRAGDWNSAFTKRHAPI